MIFERGRGFGQFLRRGFRCELGSTAAEFALLFPPLLWLLFGGLQLALVYTAQGVLDDAAEIASRKISTGQAQTGNLSAAQLKSSLCAPLSSLLNCGQLMVDVHVASSISPTDAAYPTLTFDSNGQVTNAWKYEPGEPGQTVVVRLMYQWPTVVIPGLNLSNLPDGKRLLVSTNVIRTESYK